MNGEGPYANLARALNAPGEASRMGAVSFPKDALEFFRGVTRLAELARAHGEVDDFGDPVWQIVHWQAFCRGVRAYKHMGVLGLGMAAYRTCIDVESWLASGMDAFDIHEALRDGGVEQEIHRLKQLASSDRRPVYHTAYLVEDDQT